jgi:hypothetical protein
MLPMKAIHGNFETSGHKSANFCGDSKENSFKLSPNKWGFYEHFASGHRSPGAGVITAKGLYWFFRGNFLGSSWIFFIGIFLGTQAISDGGIPSKKVVKKCIIKKKMGSKQETTEIGNSWNFPWNPPLKDSRNFPQ